MKTTLSIAVAAGLVLALGAPDPLPGQSRRAVLEPENANEARLNRLQPPDLVMDVFGIGPGMTVAEIGAGRGRYVVHLAVRVGESGRVFAEDIDREALADLARRCKQGGLKNVETIAGEVDDPKLPEGRIDRLFIISSYHHFSDPIALMRKARAALKPDGKLAIGEWDPASGGEGVPAEKVRAQMEAAGFVLEKIDASLKENRMNLFLFRVGRTRE